MPDDMVHGQAVWHGTLLLNKIRAPSLPLPTSFRRPSELCAAGVKGLSVLKTTQSGYEGFLHDQYTLLPDTRERILATSITATWHYDPGTPDFLNADFDALYSGAKKAMLDTFYGPADNGVYSPSVQYTLYQMGDAIVKSVRPVDSVFLNLPNLHFLPAKPAGIDFQDDVYIAASDPSGNIEAVVTREGHSPHCKL